MAIISSYPTITPQFADKVLGSNNVDSYGDAVQGNPTVQYSMESVKTLVDQQFIEQINTSKTSIYSPPRDNTGEALIFGSVDLGIGTSNVMYTAATGTITFNAIGTYFIQQSYLGAGGVEGNPYLLMKILQNGATQVGPTKTFWWFSKVNAAKFNISIETMVNITTAGTYYNFWSCSPTDGGATTLEPQLTGGFGTDTPSAQLIISKLV